MSLEEIIARIKNDALNQSNLILKQANAESAKIRHKYAQKVKVIVESETRENDSRCTELRNVQLAVAHRTGRQIILNAEEELIQNCFSKLSETLGERDGTTNEHSLKNLIKKGLRLLDGGAKIRLVRKTDLEIAQRIKTELESILVSEGIKNPQIEIDNELMSSEYIGGVYLESLDGKKVVDSTYKSIIERNKESYRIEISRILFD